MFDDLRQQAEQAEGVEGAPFSGLEDAPEEEMERPARRIPIISSLNPLQRFVLAFMLFLNVCVLGCFCLLATERIVLPF